MPPALTPFPPSELADRVQINADGRRRKKHIDLKQDCSLKSLTQYNCEIEYKDSQDRRGEIVCRPVVRLFRQCAGLTVETSSWEGQSLGDERPQAELTLDYSGLDNNKNTKS